ncbi:hypothetical protein TrRE_jg8133, partial [Triparma retinervis]
MASKRASSRDIRAVDRTPTPTPTYESSFVSQWPISSISAPDVFAGSKRGVIAGNMNSMGVFDAKDGSSVATATVVARGEVTSVGVSGCGTYVYTGSSDGKVRKWLVGSLSIDCLSESDRLGDDWINQVSVSPGLNQEGRIVVG